MSQRIVVTLQVLLSALSLSSTCVAASAPPDLQEMRKAVVVVVAKGVVPSLGNAPAAVQGTGFFVSKDGYLVTSFHLHSELGQIDESSVRWEIHLGPSEGDVVPAMPVFVNPSVDIVVLHANVEDRSIRALLQPDDTPIALLSTTVYTAGYPQGYSYSVSQGFVKSWSPDNSPFAICATSLTFKVGQSGSPVVLDSGRAIAVAKAADQDDPTTGLVVPIKHNIPTEYWDGSLQPTQSARTALLNGNTAALEKIIVTAPAKPATSQKQQAITLNNAPCEGTATQTYHVAATQGWAIDPSSIKLETLSFQGGGVQAVIADRSATGFTVAAQLSNIGTCMTVLGTRHNTDFPASFQGRVTYNEVPNPDLRESVTISNAVVLGNLKIPVPNKTDLSFSLVTPTGDVRSFQPTPGELIKKDGTVLLDVAKAAARVGEAPPV